MVMGEKRRHPMRMAPKPKLDLLVGFAFAAWRAFSSTVFIFQAWPQTPEDHSWVVLDVFIYLLLLVTTIGVAKGRTWAMAILLACGTSLFLLYPPRHFFEWDARRQTDYAVCLSITAYTAWRLSSLRRRQLPQA
jgi:hypothetical protein